MSTHRSHKQASIKEKKTPGLQLAKARKERNKKKDKDSLQSFFEAVAKYREMKSLPQGFDVVISSPSYEQEKFAAKRRWLI